MTLTAPPAALRHSPLVERLAAHFDATWVDPSTVQAWAAGPGHRVLLLAGDAVRFPEGQDVAAVLPELRRCAGVPFAIGIVALADEDGVARRYGVQRWPSLVVLRDGAYLGTLPGMHDWAPFLARLQDLLAQPGTRVPGIGIPLVSAGGDAATACHG